MMKEELNELFDEAFEQSIEKNYSESYLPDPKNSWLKIEKRLKREKQKLLWRRRLKFVPGALIFILIGAFVFGSPQVSKAFHPIYQIVQSIKGEFIAFFFGTDHDDNTGAKTLPPPQQRTKTGNSDLGEGSKGEGVSIRKQVSLEEARKEVSFDFLEPQSVPTEYKLEKTEVFYKKNAEKAEMINLWYTDPEGRSFGIMQRQLGADSMLSSGIDKSAGTVKETQINGNSAIFVTYADGRTNIQWLISSLYVDISGDLSESDIINVATNMK